MEVYVLDPLLRRHTVVDQFESLIWTERYSEIGDFELVVASSPATRRLFRPGVRLAMNESHRVMLVETYEDGEDDEGKDILSIKGRSIEAITKDRTTEAWAGTDPPATLIRDIAHDSMVAPAISYDEIPFLNIGTFLPEGTIPEPTDPVTIDIRPQNLYETLKPLADAYDLGFHIIREYDMSRLWFDVYTGNDRTTGQGVLTPVVFSKSLDNLRSTKELITIENAKNVAYVYSGSYSEIVFADGVDPEDLSGFDRRVLIEVADDLDDTDPNFFDLMIQRGKEKLGEARMYHAFDGEIPQTSQYQYQKDYFLGDIVEVRGENDVTNKMRVTEQIFVSDREGERSYPTLSKSQFITPGSWQSWQYTKFWTEFGETEFWSNQP